MTRLEIDKLTEFHTSREPHHDEDRGFYNGLKRWNNFELEAMLSYFTTTIERIQKLNLESEGLNDILYHMYVRKGMIDVELSNRRKKKNHVKQ